MTDAREQRLEAVGKAALASIVEMVAALECDYERLEELRDDRSNYERGEDDDREGTDAELWAIDNPDDAEELAELETAAGDCRDSEQARERIQEDALSVEFRSGWVTSREEMEPDEYLILLTTGGPAVRITGDIRAGEAVSAVLEVQDWGTPWTEHVTTGSDHDALLTYARCFCFDL